MTGRSSAVSKVGKGPKTERLRKRVHAQGEFSKGGRAVTMTSASTFSEVLMESKTSGFQLFLY